MPDCTDLLLHSIQNHLFTHKQSIMKSESFLKERHISLILHLICLIVMNKFCLSHFYKSSQLKLAKLSNLFPHYVFVAVKMQNLSAPPMLLCHLLFAYRTKLIILSLHEILDQNGVHWDQELKDTLHGLIDF